MNPEVERRFASDNEAGIHPRILDALIAANSGHVPSYGEDELTARAERKVAELFGGDCSVYFVFNGTAANVLSAAAAVSPFQAVICSDTSHIHHDECGAIERFIGCRVLTLPSCEQGKLNPEVLSGIPEGHAEPHQSKPRLVSITQSTELGTVYRATEVAALAAATHERGWLLHMDGARIANAAVSLSEPIAAFTKDAGVDLLSFGGTKCGIMAGEAVVALNPEVARHLPYVRKQGLQLASKMRFLSAQFDALLSDDLWLQIAGHANAMARRLRDAIADVDGVEVTRPTEANAVFVRLPKERIADLQAQRFFHVWDPATGEVRWMTAFDTTEQDVDEFVASVRRLLS